MIATRARHQHTPVTWVIASSLACLLVVESHAAGVELVRRMALPALDPSAQLSTGGRVAVGTPAEELRRAAVPFLGEQSLGILMGLGAAAIASKRYENAAYMARSLDGSPAEAWIDIGDRYGDGLTLGAATLGLLATGHIRGDPRMSGAGRDLGAAFLMSSAGVWALKLSVDARRPDGGPHSFPSGHTATAFAAAPVLTHYYGWRVGIPAYALAVGTALGRMEDRRHYVADVLFGAAIGLVAGSEQVGGEGLPGFLRYLRVFPNGIGIGVGD